VNIYDPLLSEAHQTLNFSLEI
jgi:methylthioribulose-1-phosphate dehydratase